MLIRCAFQNPRTPSAARTSRATSSTCVLSVFRSTSSSLTRSNGATHVRLTMADTAPLSNRLALLSALSSCVSGAGAILRTGGGGVWGWLWASHDKSGGSRVGASRGGKVAGDVLIEANARGCTTWGACRVCNSLPGGLRKHRRAPVSCTTANEVVWVGEGSRRRAGRGADAKSASDTSLLYTSCPGIVPSHHTSCGSGKPLLSSMSR